MEIIVTDNAFDRLSILAINDPELMLRISVDGGGCSGFRYKYELTKNKSKHDIVISKNNLNIIIDDLSVTFLENSTIDYVETLGGGSFEIKNPNATIKCGCGNSFSV